MDYTASLIWLTVWPLIIFLGYKFTAFNLQHFKRLEELEEEH
ncbi:hypothetical protein [Sulfurovum mangrovi]|nr:hypothetical protein [Sulfurovum mangrovi]